MAALGRLPEYVEEFPNAGPPRCANFISFEISDCV